MQRWRRVGTGMMAVSLVYTLLLFACSVGETQPREKSSPPSPSPSAEKKELASAAPRKPYEIGGKTFYPPVAIRYSDMHMEGSTRFVQIVDTRGKKLLACNDARGYLNAKDEPLDRPIYIGGEHPIHKGSKPLPLGGADEQELSRMLRDWSDEGQRLGGPPLPRELGADSQRAENAKKFLIFLEQHVERHKPK